MLEQFIITYEIHPWLRRVSWGALGIGGILLFEISGGFPPQAWRLLAATLPQLSRLWALRGPGILLPLALIVIQSLAWLIAWGLLIAACVAILRHWRRSERERQAFEEDLSGAHDAVTQEQAPLAWSQPSARTHAPLVLSDHLPAERHADSSQWQRQLPLHFDVGVGWDAGIRRQKEPNEDSLIALQGTCIYNAKLLPFGLFVVADGMGGHADGQDASYLAIQKVVKTVLPNIVGSDEMSDEVIVEVLAESVQQANMAVCQRSQEIGADMGTTITAALVMDTTAFIVNVGDSRTYLYRSCKGLSQVTRDHSHVATLVAAGQIGRDDIYTHPDRNQVYRALGVKKRMEVDWFTIPMQADDCLLLCSDGLWEMVRDPEIEKILQQQKDSPSQASKALIAAALKGGGSDNISAIVVRVTPTTVELVERTLA